VIGSANRFVGTYRAIGICALILLTLSALNCSGSGTTNQANQRQAEAARNTVPIQVTSSDLEKAYNSNVVAADYRYTDKLLSVTGVVQGIQRFQDNIHVHLQTGTFYGYMTCVFSNDRFEDVVPLNTGERATIKGICKGRKWHDTVVMEDCFVSNTPIPAPTRQSVLPPIQPTVKPNSGSSFGATARCRDGTLSYSAHRQGTCSHHGGVAEWY
jgi:hypothetical protein